ncbi:MAG: SH3 domain-containing protein [Stenotrophomonas sp.]|uniref:C40 family peptidase n=1 Tax=Stenotrophomonas sp. TaxID=69392 RepID=UPI003D6CF4D1
MIQASPRRPVRPAWPTRALLMLLLAVPGPTLWAQPADTPRDNHGGVPGLNAFMLEPSLWASFVPQPDRQMLSRAGIDAQNARMRAEDTSIHDLRALPATLPRARVRADIQALSRWPEKALFGEDGKPVAASARAAIEANLGLDTIPAERPLQYGLVTHRAALRAFPTALRVFTTQGDTDIDRFQESALFPGDAVAVLHESADRQWLFITSERYSAWIETRFVGVGDADTVFGYGGHGPHRVVTGATASTTFTPEEPRVSRLQLDMGVRLPVLADWPVQTPVNGQQAHASHVVQLPVRNEDGSLALVPALIARAEDTAPEYLNLTPRNLLNQAFKFLGERYGWGHSYDTRDCSGFVSEVYRSFGILLPRNTSAQAVSPALDRIAFTAKDDKARRIAAVQQLQLGNLVYIPGHVMMTIGRINGQTWVIHDTAGGSWFGPDGKRVQAHLNGVSVTPLEPMMASDTVSYIDRITNIQRIRPQTP